MQAGIDFGKTGVTAKVVRPNTETANSSQRKRRGKEVNTAEEGFLISQQGSAKLREAYANGTMHPGMRELYDAALKAGRMNDPPGQTPINSPYNDQANTNNVNYAYSIHPGGNLAPGLMGSHKIPNTADSLANNPGVSNQELENRWQPLAPFQGNKMQHNSGSNDVTPKASNIPEITHTNEEELSEPSIATSSDDDDENDPTFGKKSSRNKGATPKRQGSASVKRKATTQMAGSKRPRGASGPQQVDGAIDLTISPTPNQKPCGIRDTKS